MLVADELSASNGSAVVRLGPDASVHGRITTPDGSVWLKQGTTAVGTFLGRRVRIGPNVSVTKDGG